MNSEEFDAFTREITSNMSRRKVLVYLGRVLVAALGVRWIFGLGRLKVGAQHHCFPVMDNGHCIKGMYKRRKPDFEPTYNGCGSKGVTEKIVPNRFFAADFTPACNKHDLCYSDCYRTKKECDREFYDDLVAVCRQTYSSGWEAIPRELCEIAAWGYYQAVNQFGNRFWAAAQVKGCQCCLY